MSESTLIEEITELLATAFELDPEDITPEARLVEDLGLDSIDAIDISARARRITGRKMTDDEIRSLRTVGDVFRLVERMTTERA